MYVTLKPLIATFVDVILHTACCALHRKDIVSVHLHTGSVLAERVGQGKVGGVTCRVTCTWWLL